MLRLGLVTKYIDGLCQKLEKTLSKGQNCALEYFIWYFIAIFMDQPGIGIYNFWLKSALKSHSMYPVCIISLQYVLLQRKKAWKNLQYK